MKLFKKVKEKIGYFLFPNLVKGLDPKIGKTVIHFTTHGCMAQIHEFDYIGTIEDTCYNGEHMYYLVKVLKDKGGESRDGNTKESFEKVPSWYLQKLDTYSDFYIAYD